MQHGYSVTPLLHSLRAAFSALYIGLFAVPAIAAGEGLIFDPDIFVDAEFKRSGALSLINAQYAYARGYTGQGVLVAIFDSGLYRDHPEFHGRISPLGRNFASDQAPGDYADTELDENGLIDGHGTHVAGIIGAARDGIQMHGVAYNATLLPMRMKDETPDAALFYYAARAGAQVMNGSYGPNGTPPMTDEHDNPNPWYADALHNNPHLLKYQMVSIKNLEERVAALRYAAAADVLMVFAAGNDYKNYISQASHVSGHGMYHLINPDYIAGLDPMFRFLDELATPDLLNPSTYVIIPFNDPRVKDLDFSDLGGALISVVAVDRDGKITDYSNRCGHAAMWCLAAPGGDNSGKIYSANPDPRNGYYVGMDGTSMAAPVVSGAAAVLREAFPYMSARQIIEVMLTTTNSSGLYDDDQIYGRGLLDLGRAIQGPGEFGADGFGQTFMADTRGFDSLWSNDITGDGGLTKRGAGTLRMTGINTYTGKTSVEGGRLLVNGDSRTSTFETQTGGTLGGSGILGSTTVWGTLAPGNSIGTLTVAGDYTQHPGSVLEIEVDGAGNSDLLQVNGTANIQGGTVQLLGITSGSLGRQYRFIDATIALNGAFDAISNPYIFVDARQTGTARSLSLSITRSATTFASLARTLNQQTVASAIEAQGAGSAAYDALITLQGAGSAPDVYDQFSGEIHASTRSALIEDSRFLRQASLTRMQAAAPRPPGNGHTTRNVSLWGQTFGSWATFEGGRTTHDLHRNISGLMFGGEHDWGRRGKAGLALAYSNARLQGEAHNQARVDGYHLMAYASAGLDAFTLRGGASQSWFDIDTTRRIEYASLGAQTSRYRASSTQLFGEAAYVLPAGSAAIIEPYIGLTQVWMRTPEFNERGGAAALSGASARDAITYATIGMRNTLRISSDPHSTIQASAGLGWRHAFGDRSPQAELRFAGHEPYTINGVPIARDTLQAEFQLSMVRNGNLSLSLGYTGQIGAGVRDHGVQARMNWAF